MSGLERYDPVTWRPSGKPPRCPAVNDTLGLRCDRERGHNGAHVQDDGNGQRGWGFDYGGGR